MPKTSNILAIDTALRGCGVGLMLGGQIVSGETIPILRGQDQVLPVTVDKVLKQENVKMSNLDGIVVTTGPGSFTGIRIGLAFAKGLASALKIPLIGLTTMEVFAQQSNADHKIVIIEIKKDAYIAQFFKDGSPETDLLSFNADELGESISKSDVKNIVTHSQNIFEMFSETHSVDVLVPSPETMLQLAVQKMAQETYNNDPMRPVYVRGADVTMKAS